MKLVGAGGYFQRNELGWIGGIGVVFALLPVVATSRPQLRMITLIASFALFTIGLNIVFGHTDQLFLFVGALAGIGGYSTVILAESTGLSPWLTLPMAVGLTGAIGGLVSYIAARRNMSIILIAIFTFALQLAVNEFFVGAREITGGSVGMSAEVVNIETNLTFYYVFVALLILYLAVYAALMNSKYGLSFMAVRQDQVAASSVGVDIVRTKVIAGTIAALMIGLAGAFYAFWAGWISPGTYSFQAIDVLVLIMLTLGGMRTLTGPVVGAILLVLINDVLASYPRWRLVIFGSILIVMFLAFREGIVPKIGEIRKRLTDRRRGQEDEGPEAPASDS